MTKLTIYDVAERAGVSISTVSRVLNNPKQVKLDTRSRVLEAIDDLHYLPKPAALLSARKAVRRIGVLTQAVNTAAFTEQLDGVLAALEDTAYEVVIYSADSAVQCAGLLSSLALTQRVDGLLMVAAAPLSGTLAHSLPLVQFADRRTECGDDRGRIVVDHRLGGAMAAEYLLARGHHRLGYVGDNGTKLAGYQQSLVQAGATLVGVATVAATAGMATAREQAHCLLARDEPPSAIFAASDSQAIAVIAAARERGLAVPDDLAVVGFDDIAMAEFVGLTTIRQELKQQGRVAAEMLVAEIETPERPYRQVEMALTLQPRATA